MGAYSPNGRSITGDHNGAALLITLFAFPECTTAQTSSATFFTLHAFAGYPTDGFYLRSGVAIGPDGVLYGTTVEGGKLRSGGTAFSLTPPASPEGAWTESIYSFRGGKRGANPYGGLAIDGAGVLYGTTANGGISNGGTVFSLIPPSSPGGSWAETVIYTFKGGGDGGAPEAAVAIGSSGVLYGTTVGGGDSGNGTVFSLAPPSPPARAWTESILYSFTGGSDGGTPASSLLIGSGGVLYGATSWGGTGTCVSDGIGCGTVFSLSPPASLGGSWTEKVLYSFGGSDGFSPSGPVTIGSGGVLYGTTTEGGPSGTGTVFSLTPPAHLGGAWAEAVLCGFGDSTEGTFPVGGVVIGSGGVLFGTTKEGGGSNQGTVFSLTPPASPGSPWTETVLYNFTGGSDGGEPLAGVAIDNSGVLYGTTEYGGIRKRRNSGCGTVFMLTP
jgi:uncharacterized repeat protein (TIGR03803 family)